MRLYGTVILDATSMMPVEIYLRLPGLMVLLFEIIAYIRPTAPNMYTTIVTTSPSGSIPRAGRYSHTTLMTNSSTAELLVGNGQLATTLSGDASQKHGMVKRL